MGEFAFPKPPFLITAISPNIDAQAQTCFPVGSYMPGVEWVNQATDLSGGPVT